MFELITITSVQHTGTRSVIDVFRDKFPEFNYIEHNSLKYLHDMFSFSEGLLDPRCGNILYGHITPYTFDVIGRISQYWQIIVPVRDPLLVLISNNFRNSNDEKYDAPYMSILVSFFILVEYISKMNPFYVPIGLDLSGLDYCGVKFNDMKISNSSGTYPLKDAYFSGDLEFIKNSLGDAFYMLCQMEFILRPFLEKLGYTDLIWYGHTNNVTKDVLMGKILQLCTNYIPTN